MQYRYYILQIFLFLTLVLNVWGAWGQTQLQYSKLNFLDVFDDKFRLDKIIRTPSNNVLAYSDNNLIDLENSEKIKNALDFAKIKGLEKVEIRDLIPLKNAEYAAIINLYPWTGDKSEFGVFNPLRDYLNKNGVWGTFGPFVVIFDSKFAVKSFKLLFETLIEINQIPAYELRIYPTKMFFLTNLNEDPKLVTLHSIYEENVGTTDVQVRIYDLDANFNYKSISLPLELSKNPIFDKYFNSFGPLSRVDFIEGENVNDFWVYTGINKKGLNTIASSVPDGEETYVLHIQNGKVVEATFVNNLNMAPTTVRICKDFITTHTQFTTNVDDLNKTRLHVLDSKGVIIKTIIIDDYLKDPRLLCYAKTNNSTNVEYIFQDAQESTNPIKYHRFKISKDGLFKKDILIDNITGGRGYGLLTLNYAGHLTIIAKSEYGTVLNYVVYENPSVPPPLTPAFSFTPATPQVNQAVTFKDESTGSPTSWAWDFGDGTTSTLQNPTKTYNKAGNYTVKFTINKQGATSASTTKSITIAAEATTLTLSATTSNAPVGGQQGSLNLTTNTNWTASSNAAWLKVSLTNGNAGTNVVVNYTVDANNATAARTGIITFTAGTQTATFTVTQAGVTPSLAVSPTAPATIGAAGSTVALSVVSNLSWSVAKSANSDWLIVSPTSGTGNQNVSATASANATTVERSATLTFSAAGVANVIVTVRQAGVNASLSLSATTSNAPVGGQQGSLNLTTNTNWIVSSNAAWLKVSPTSGNAGTNVVVNYTVEANTATAARTGIITFTAGTQTATFTVTQAGIIPQLSLSAESKSVAATGESGQLGITSNVPWSATSNVAWLTFSPANGGIGVINNFRYGVEANPNTTTRTGVITFSASGLTKTFTVTQEGTKPTPPQAPTQLTVTATSEYELRISWKDNASNETSYELERADGLLLGPTNSDFKKIATLPANSTTFLDQKLTSKSQYCYRVRAVNAVGVSDFMEAVCGTTNAPSAGITLMVHGFNPSDDADFKENFAVISQAIKERAGAGATVYTNDPTKGTWRKWELVENNGNGDPTKEIILFYNWADASNTELYALLNNLPYMSNSGYLEGSADILFAMLADAQIPNLPNNLLTSGKPLHFIGHSRGNVLFLQLMHRMAKWFPTVKIDHYTALDPHPATNMGDVVRNQKNTYASLPLVSGEASGCTATIGCSSASTGDKEIKIRIPENVAKAEVYYRKDGDYEDSDSALENLASRFGDPEIYANAVIFITNYFLPPWLQIQYQNRFRRLLVAFDGVPSIGGVNHQLDNDKISEGKTGGFGGAHSGVVSWYFGTIDTKLTNSDGEPISYDGEPLYLNQWYGTNGALLATKPAREKSGYYFSRIGGGYAQLADATNKVSLTTMDSQLAERPRLNNTDGGMKLGIQNGNFEYKNNSGWAYGDGNIAPNNQAKNGQLIISGSGLSIKPEINITHSLMYYPANFNYVMAHIKFDTKQTATKTFSVQFLNRDFAAVGQPIEVIPTKNDTKAYIKIPASLKGKSGSFTIKGTGILVEKVELSDRTGSQDVIIESLAQPETPQTVEALYEIFPNPNNGRFSLTSQDAQMPAIAVVVVDVIGNVLFKATDNQLSVFNAQQKLDIALPSGFTGSYTLRVETAQGVSFKRIIKE